MVEWLQSWKKGFMPESIRNRKPHVLSIRSDQTVDAFNTSDTATLCNLQFLYPWKGNPWLGWVIGTASLISYRENISKLLHDRLNEAPERKKREQPCLISGF